MTDCKLIKVGILGSGILAQHIAHYVHNGKGYKIIGFYDDYRKPGDLTPYGRILGPISQVKDDYDYNFFDELIIGIGYNHLNLRKILFEDLTKTIKFTTYIHPSCIVDSACRFGAGVIALPGCIFDMNVVIGDNVFFNIGCIVAHDSKVSSHSFFGPAVKLAGFVDIHQECFIGIGTTVIDNIYICSGARTGGGAVITKSLMQPGLYAGIPAKFIKPLK